MARNPSFSDQYDYPVDETQPVAGRRSDGSLRSGITAISTDASNISHGTPGQAANMLIPGTVAICIEGPPLKVTTAESAEVEAGKQFYAVLFSQEMPDDLPLKQRLVRPVTLLDRGRIWMWWHTDGYTMPTVKSGTLVTINDRARAGDMDVRGAVKIAGAGDTPIDGWRFTGETAYDGMTGYSIAEVEIGRP